MKPVRIFGNWYEGFVLDNHMEKSIFLGYDKNGKEIFENTRMTLGELIYQYKYMQNTQAMNKIMLMIEPFLDRWKIKQKIDLVIPVPPSNKNRKFQPVFELAKQISIYLEKDCRCDILYKINNIQAKDGYNITGTIQQIKNVSTPSNILIIDDLISSGKTLIETCKVISKDKNIKRIYCLIMTKTKRR